MITSERRIYKINRRRRSISWVLVILIISITMILKSYKDIDILREKYYTQKTQIENDQFLIKGLTNKLDSILNIKKPEIKKQIYIPVISIKKDTTNLIKDTIFPKKDTLSLIKDTIN